MELTRFTPYILGDEQLDREHHEIYLALEAMWKTIPPDAIPRLMEEARKACYTHFSHEEKLMRDNNYPFQESHIEVHNTALKKFIDVIDSPTTENLRLLVDEFLNHIDLYDRLFVQFLNENKRRRIGDHQ